MKKIVIVLFLLIASRGWSKSLKPNPADYTISVRVTSSYLVRECTSVESFNHELQCASVQHLKVVIDGKKYELAENGVSGIYVLETGTYRAKVVEDSKPSAGQGSACEYHRKYDVMFSDGGTRGYDVIGEEE